MKPMLFCALIAVAGCGGGAASTPAPTGPDESTDPAGTTEPAQDAELCCCEIPSVDPFHEMMPAESCPAQGYCVDVEACSPTE